MQQTGYRHANMLAQQLQTNLDNQQSEMLAMVQSMVPVAQESAAEQHNVEQQVANAAVTSVQQQMFEILQATQVTQNATATNNGGNTNNNNGGGENSRRQLNRRTPDNVTFARQDTSKYCHTHGGCNHYSSECNRRAPGHKTNATFTDRMGGSNAFCTSANNK